MTYESLKRVVEHIQAARPRADYLALTGDLVQDDSARAYEHFLPLLGPLSLPVLCVPGNHDDPDLMRTKLADAPFFWCPVVDHGNWRLIFLDSCRPGSDAGYIRDAELTRLTAALNTAGDAHCAVLLHHPPVCIGSAWLDTVGLENREALFRVIDARRNVRLMLFGHAHQDFDGRRGAARIIGTPSTGSQFKPLADTFAIDDKPPAYRRLELRADGSVGGELIWVDRPAG